MYFLLHHVVANNSEPACELDENCNDFGNEMKKAVECIANSNHD